MSVWSCDSRPSLRNFRDRENIARAKVARYLLSVDWCAWKKTLVFNGMHWSWETRSHIGRAFNQNRLFQSSSRRGGYCLRSGWYWLLQWVKSSRAIWCHSPRPLEWFFLWESKGRRGATRSGRWWLLLLQEVGWWSRVSWSKSSRRQLEQFRSEESISRAKRVHARRGRWWLLSRDEWRWDEWRWDEWTINGVGDWK